MSDFFDRFFQLWASAGPYETPPVMGVTVRLPPHLDTGTREDIKRLIDIHHGVNFLDVPLDMVLDERGSDTPVDLVETGMVGLNLVSDRFIQVLQENNFSGWITYPVSVIKPDGSEMGGYHGFAVTGRCGPTSYRDELVEYLPPPNPIYKRKGLIFKPESWDGSDIFKGDEETMSTYVTEEVKRTLNKFKLTNLRFVRFTEKFKP